MSDRSLEVDRIHRFKGENAGEEQLSVFSRAILGDDDKASLETAPDGSIVVSRSGTVLADKNGCFIGGTEPGTFAAGNDPRLLNDAFFTRLPEGTKLRGGNIGTSINQTPINGDVWAARWVAWDAADIHHQIDLAAGAGLNVVRLMGGPNAIYAGRITEADYMGHVDDICNYAASKRIYFYPSLASYVPPAGVTLSDWTGLLTRLLQRYQVHPNVFAVDLINEPDGGQPSGTINQLCGGDLYTGLTSVYTALKAVAQVPLTVSMLGIKYGNYGFDAFSNADYLSAMQGMTDFWDLHAYNKTYFTESYLSAITATGRPILFGEFGSHDTGGTTYATFNMPVAQIRQLSLALPQVIGALVWLLQDQGDPGGPTPIFDSTGALTVYGQGVANLPIRYNRYTSSAPMPQALVLSADPILLRQNDPHQISPFVCYSSPSGQIWQGIGANYQPEIGLFGSTDTIRLNVINGLQHTGVLKIVAGSATQLSVGPNGFYLLGLPTSNPGQYKIWTDPAADGALKMGH